MEGRSVVRDPQKCGITHGIKRHAVGEGESRGESYLGKIETE